MKKFAIILLVFAGCAKPIPFSSTLPSKIVTVKKTKAQILEDSEVFIANTFVSAKDVIEVKNSNLIIGKGISTPLKFKWSYSFIIRANENRLRYEFYNVTMNDAFDYNTPTQFLFNRKTWDREKGMIYERLTAIAKSYEDYIKADNSTF